MRSGVITLFTFFLLIMSGFCVQVFRSPTSFTYFRWRDFWDGIEPIFVNKFWFIFGGALTKMAIKLPIIDVDPYIIPHFNANMLRVAMNSSCVTFTIMFGFVATSMSQRWQIDTSLLESYPDHLDAVKKAGGGHTKYWVWPRISL